METYEPSMPLVVLGRRRLTMADSRRRVRGKQLTPAAYVLPSPALRAIADEGFCELRALQEDARRQHPFSFLLPDCERVTPCMLC